jgi:hypothetical protein
MTRRSKAERAIKKGKRGEISDSHKAKRSNSKAMDIYVLNISGLGYIEGNAACN